MPREISLPYLPQFPKKLPLEDKLDRLLDSVGARISRHPIIRKAEEVYSRIPYIPERRMGTPFGEIKTPEVSLPRLIPPKMDDRRRDGLKATMAIDASSLIATVPVIGEAIADVVEDTYGAKVRETLTREEMDLYVKYDKLGPSTLAALRAFVMSEPRR